MFTKTSVNAYFTFVIGTPPCESLPVETSVTLYDKARTSENRIHRMEESSSLPLLWSDLFLLTPKRALQFDLHPHHGKNANARIGLQ